MEGATMEPDQPIPTSAPAEHQTADHQAVPNIVGNVPTLLWSNTDAVHLSPSALPLPRALRAWDRKPQSPFSRRRLKVGKVWKRAIPPPANSTVKRRVSLSPSKKATKKIRLDGGNGVGIGWEGLGQPERRIVTRSGRAIEGGELLELSEEDATTATNADAPAASREDDDSDDANDDADEKSWEDVGQQLDTREVAEAARVGEDVIEEVEESGADVLREQLAASQADEESRAGVILFEHFAGPPVLSTSHAVAVDQVEHQHSPIASPSTFLLCHEHAHEPASDTSIPANPQESSEEYAKAPDLEREIGSNDSSGPTLPNPNQSDLAESDTNQEQITTPLRMINIAPVAQTAVVLPAGFVSPMKERRRRSARQTRSISANRRQTLPMNFSLLESPADISQKAIVTEIAQGEETEESSSESQVQKVLAEGSGESQEQVLTVDAGCGDKGDERGAGDVEQDLELHVSDTSPDLDEWEDLDDEDDLDEDTAQSNEALAETLLFTDDDKLRTEEVVPAAFRVDDGESDKTQSPALLKQVVMDQSYQLPLRRSPRRKSCSPRNRDAVQQPWQTRSHLVAFTPIKMPAQRLSNQQKNEVDDEDMLVQESIEADGNGISIVRDDHPPVDLEDFQIAEMGQRTDESQQITRSSSAPPASPRNSPRKVRQPRISDDTALLQAFLNRAAQSKSLAEKNQSTATRESQENRRESDSVRLALAGDEERSEANDRRSEMEVLKDLDPNSPSPRKQHALSSKLNQSEQHKAITIEQDVHIDDNDDSAERGSPTNSQKKRRSTRTKRSSQANLASEPTSVSPNGVLAGSLPNKISIRANMGETIVLRKTEAQEIAILTRTNTKRNKGSAIIPTMRLTRLLAEEAGLLQNEDEEEPTTVEQKRPRKTPKSVTWAAALERFQDGSERSSENAGSQSDDPTATTVQEETSTADKLVKPRGKKLKPRLTPRPTGSLIPEEDPAGDGDPLTEAPVSVLKPEGGLPPLGSSTSSTSGGSKMHRVSRIATPAKTKGSDKSVLAAATENIASEAGKDTTTTLDLPGVTLIPSLIAKRPLVSKLPAPVSSFANMSAASDPSREKQGPAPIASPPKKKMRMRTSNRQQQLKEPQSLLAVPTPPLSFGAPKTIPSILFTAGNSTQKITIPRPSIPTTTGASASVIGGSPAKKAPKLFATGATTGSMSDSAPPREILGGMGSPAKKRGRRL